jgi:single-stranded-DNA-specific exonuclease
MVEKRWTMRQTDLTAVKKLKESLLVSTTLCTLLTQRGITNYEEAKNFFVPSLNHLHSPWLMKGMQEAVDRITAAIHHREKILVFGDYDVDGTTSVASFYQFISQVYDDAQTGFYIPHRYREGYGVSKAGIDYAHENNYSLIVCLDCGIKSVELIAYAKTLGIDFIICDHHLPGTILPEAVAILNPKQTDCPYPYKELCGCGVGFKLMSALAESFNLEKESVHAYLDLVATAIAADIVPMNGENRILAFHGLHQINTNPCEGIKALIKLGNIRKELTITNVVFVIAPRVNAAGRMDDARKAVELFIEKDETKAIELAALLQSDNTDRREADTSITAEALEMIATDPQHGNTVSAVLYREDWHKGVVGIVASRVIEHHHRPTVVLTRNDALVTGSARSIPGFNLYEAIYACRELLVAYGGHFAAAGLSLLPENVEAFRKKFEEVVSSTIDFKLLTPELIIDCPLRFSEINDSLYRSLQRMEPFGPENLHPVFIATKVKNLSFSRIVKNLHVRFVLEQDGFKFTGIGFNLAHKFNKHKPGDELDIVFTIDENEWQGNSSLQLKVIDFRLAEA